MQVPGCGWKTGAARVDLMLHCNKAKAAMRVLLACADCLVMHQTGLFEPSSKSTCAGRMAIMLQTV